MFKLLPSTVNYTILVSIFLLYLIWPAQRSVQIRKTGLKRGVRYLAFFHPFCASGGGGERVLWTAIEAILERNTVDTCLVYAIKPHANARTLDLVKEQFGISIAKNRVIFLPLLTWKFLEASLYPRFTLILSCVGSMITGWEALRIYRPDILFETVGFSFIYPQFKLFGSKIVAYVHYPTISSDMLKLVEIRQSSFNNSPLISSSKYLTKSKLYYYQAFSKIYGITGRISDVVLVNSSWTNQHIAEIWRKNTEIVYPPCDTSQLLHFPLENRKKIVVSIGQFRPEKNHHFQLEIWADFLRTHMEHRDAKLIMIGGVRKNTNDCELVVRLRDKVKELSLEDNVQIIENASFSSLMAYLCMAKVGIHTMKNEHFGISIIEYMVMINLPRQQG